MELRLLLGSLAKRISAKIDFFAFKVHPDNAVAIFSNLELFEVLRLLQIGEDTSTRDDRPQVDDPRISIIPLDFQYTMDDWLGRDDARDLGQHITIPAPASPDPPNIPSPAPGR